MTEQKRSDRPRRRAAAALRYSPSEDPAPKVAAVGRGHVAERIIAVAAEHGIPVYDDPDLVEVLAQLDLGDVIPLELYQVIAEVLVYVYKINSLAGVQSGERSARTGPYSQI